MKIALHVQKPVSQNKLHFSAQTDAICGDHRELSDIDAPIARDVEESAAKNDTSNRVDTDSSCLSVLSGGFLPKTPIMGICEIFWGPTPQRFALAVGRSNVFDASPHRF